jgi:glycosyltransferase involved in cell wall biosynthesis
MSGRLFIRDLVSTVIPVHNRPDMLREAVASVRAQTYRPLEIIVVDDGSTDETPRVCSELAQNCPEFRWLQIRNSGPGTAREAGREQARGEFLQYLDSDDLLRPRKFEVMVGLLRAQPECGVAYGPTREYEDGHSDVSWSLSGSATPLETLFPSLLAGRIWQTVSPLFRWDVIEAVGPWTDLRQEEDWEYDARVAVLGVRLAWTSEVLSDFRHHASVRAGGSSLRDPAKMRWRCRAHRLIYEHARRFGVEADDPYMQHYARELFLLARQCGDAGLGEEARLLFELAREASGPARARGLDFRLYRLAAGLLGWVTAGRVACWTDRFRLNP